MLRHIADREVSPRDRKGRLCQLRVSVQPLTQLLRTDARGSPFFHHPAKPHQVCGERLGRGAELIGVLQTVDIHHEAMGAEIACIRKVSSKSLIKAAPAGIIAAFDFPTASVAMLLRHAVIMPFRLDVCNGPKADIRLG